jgi:hypothetical protein
MEIVSACLARDLPVYRLTSESLRTHIPKASLHLITRKQDFSKFRDACGSNLQLWDEDTLVPQMTLSSLRQHPLPFFPAGAAWYFQQFLKWGFLEHSNADSHYLIWDADTILLRPLEFFNHEDRAFLTTSSEYHLPYFQTFEALIGQPPTDRVSFISQHQLIDKSILRELLAEISSKSPSGRGWAWSVIENLKGNGTNLFSEYETYGHYARLRHPGQILLRELPWTRHGRKLAGYPPRSECFESIAKSNAFAAFEANASLRGFCIHTLRKLLNWY